MFCYAEVEKNNFKWICVYLEPLSISSVAKQCDNIDNVFRKEVVVNFACPLKVCFVFEWKLSAMISHSFIAASLGSFIVNSEEYATFFLLSHPRFLCCSPF